MLIGEEGSTGTLWSVGGCSRGEWTCWGGGGEVSTLVLVLGALVLLGAHWAQGAFLVFLNSGVMFNASFRSVARFRFRFRFRCRFIYYWSMITHRNFVSIGFDNTIQQCNTTQYIKLCEYIIEHYTNNMSQLINQWITNKTNYNCMPICMKSTNSIYGEHLKSTGRDRSWTGD